MNRRRFLSTTAKSTALAVSTGVIAACSTQLAFPTVAPVGPTAAATTAPVSPASVPTVLGQAQPVVAWDMPMSWPSSLDVLVDGARALADRVAAATGGNFKITPHVAGEIAPGNKVLDLISDGAYPIGFTASYYFVDKSPVLGFGTSMPFGLTAQQQNAWLYDGGGLELLREFYKRKFNLIQFPAGNTGAQMGGWFRKAITAVEDLKGLKMRIPGLGGQVMSRLGVEALALTGPEIAPALEAGTLDAAEWVGPYDDEKLGLNKYAQYYYYPGWWEPGPTVELEVNLDRWAELPQAYQEALAAAATQANIEILARYDVRNGSALTDLLKTGVKLTEFPKAVLDAALAETNQLYSEFSAADADFKAIFTQWSGFRDQIRAWNKVNQASFETFVYSV